MILKRAAALILSVPLLHLNIQRADVACASHDRSQDTAPQGHHAVADSHSHEAAPATQPGQAGQDESCNVPAQRDCCRAVVSCSVVLGLDDGTSADESGSLDTAAAVATSAIPLSRVAAPDPPPPKA